MADERESPVVPYGKSATSINSQVWLRVIVCVTSVYGARHSQLQTRELSIRIADK